MYPQKEERVIPPLYIPYQWRNFLQRVVRLEPGRSYTIVVFMSKDGESEPVWTVKDEGKVENQR